MTNSVTLTGAGEAKRIGVVPLVEGDKLVELRLTADYQKFVQLNSDGKFFVHRRSDGKRLLVGAHVDDEIVVTTDEGLYDTTYEGAPPDHPLAHSRRQRTLTATTNSRHRCAGPAWRMRCFSAGM